MRLSQIAEKIAAAEPWRDVAGVHGVLRNPLVKILFDREAKRSRTSPDEYGPSELVRARIFVAMHDAGLNSADMATVDYALRSGGDYFASGAAPIGRAFTALGEIERGTWAGENWNIQLRILADVSGRRKVVPLISNSDAVDFGFDRVDRALGQALLGVIVLPVSRFLAPLLGTAE